MARALFKGAFRSLSWNETRIMSSIAAASPTIKLSLPNRHQFRLVISDCRVATTGRGCISSWTATLKHREETTTTGTDNSWLNKLRENWNSSSGIVESTKVRIVSNRTPSLERRYQKKKHTHTRARERERERKREKNVLCLATIYLLTCSKQKHRTKEDWFRENWKFPRQDETFAFRETWRIIGMPVAVNIIARG